MCLRHNANGGRRREGGEQVCEVVGGKEGMKGTASPDAVLGNKWVDGMVRFQLKNGPGSNANRTVFGFGKSNMKGNPSLTSHALEQ